MANNIGGKGSSTSRNDNTPETLTEERRLLETRDEFAAIELAEQLSLYFVCLRLGFKGQFHDRPQELADYSRRLFTRLPAYAGTRAKEMFPEAYQHNQTIRADYKLGMSLAIVVFVFFSIIVTTLITFQVAWKSATGEIRSAAEQVQEDGEYWRTAEPAGQGDADS